MSTELKSFKEIAKNPSLEGTERTIHLLRFCGMPLRDPAADRRMLQLRINTPTNSFGYSIDLTKDQAISVACEILENFS